MVEKIDGLEKQGNDVGLHYENETRVDFIKDAILFKTDDVPDADVLKFGSKHTDLAHYHDVDCIRLPYNNIALQIGKNRLYWITIFEEEKDCLSYLTITDLSRALIESQQETFQQCAKLLRSGKIHKNVYDDMVDVFGHINQHEVALHYDDKSIHLCKINGRAAESFETKDPFSDNFIATTKGGVFKKFYAYFSYSLTVVLYFITLLNCINIKTVKNTAPPKLQTKRKRRGKLPIASYYTLEVKPTKKSKKGFVGQPTQDHNRVHLCRGHFKRYTAEKPLFGHLVGMWWWHPSVRGRNKDGVIVKDYKVTEQECQQQEQWKSNIIKAVK
jgi:hypothetical protein